MILRLCYALLCLCALALAQSTLTTTNANGATIIELITTDPVRGPVTSIVTTIAPATPTGPRTLTDSGPITTPINQGPVGQPPPTTGTPGGPTPFTYITVVGGSTVRVADIFTPTVIATTPVTPPATGSILAYSDFLTQFGTKAASLSSSLPLAVPGILSSIMISTLAALLTLRPLV